MESALKREIQTPELRSEIVSLSSEFPDFRMAQLEDRLLSRRQARGLEHGGELLMHFVERINQPIKTWFKLDRRNRGGRPAKNLARDFLLFRLAEAAPAVIGRRPTATVNGPFVRLCTAVVAACGLDDRGIERAVEKAIKELSKEQRKGFRRPPSPPANPPRPGSAGLSICSSYPLTSLPRFQGRCWTGIRRSCGRGKAHPARDQHQPGTD